MTSISGASLDTAFANAVNGLRQATAKVNQAADMISSGNLSPEPVLALNSAKTEYSANTQVLKTADQMTKRVLDIFA